MQGKVEGKRNEVYGNKTPLFIQKISIIVTQQKITLHVGAHWFCKIKRLSKKHISKRKRSSDIYTSKIIAYRKMERWK